MKKAFQIFLGFIFMLILCWHPHYRKIFIDAAKESYRKSRRDAAIPYR